MTDKREEIETILAWLQNMAPQGTIAALVIRKEIDALRAELTAARTVEDGEVAHALVCLDTIRNGSHFGQAFSADELIGIITRLSAAKEEAERELAMAKAVADMRGMLPDALKAQVAKTIAAERERDSARADAARKQAALRSCFDFIKAEYSDDEAVAMDGHPIERGRARFVWETIVAAMTEPTVTEGAFGVTPRSHILSDSRALKPVQGEQ